MADKKIFTRSRWMVVHFILLAAVVSAGWFITDYLGERAKREILEDNKATTLLLATDLTDELKKIEGAVKAMAGSPWIVSALTTHRDGDIARANSALDRYNSALDVSVSYIMDVDGITIASSNRNDPDSFVGKSYHFRPYFTQAVTGNPGRYFGLGITSLKRGFYASFPVRGFDGEIIGVVVMKKDLDGMELQLRNYPYCFFVNKSGIIFLSSDPGLIMKSLWPLSQETEKELLGSKQFGEKPFDVIFQTEVTNRAEVILHGNTYLVSRKVIYPEGWSIVLMTTTARITIYKAVGVILTIVACLLIMIPFVITYKTVSSAEAVRRSEERFEQVAQSSQDWIWETDREGRYTYSSRAVKQILGYGPEEMIGKHYYDFYVPEEREELKETFKGFFGRTESFFRIVNKRVHQDGHHVFVESTGVALINEAGKTIGYRGTNRDITASKHLEEKLRHGEANFRRIFDQSPVGAAIVSPDYRFMRVNDALCRMMGYAQEEFVTLKFTDITHPDHLAADMEQVKRLSAGEIDEYTTEKRYIRKDDSIIWGRLSVRSIREAEGELLHFLPFIVDITERKHAEVALRQSEKKYRELYENLRDGTASVNEQGIITECNSSFLSMLGYTFEEVVRLTYKDITPYQWHEMELRILREQVDVQGYSDIYEKEYRRKDGSTFPTEIQTYLIKDVHGKPCGYWAFVRDITERKKAEEEKEKLEKGLIQAQKMEAIGTLAGGVAHDFNNLLMGIQGYTSLILLTTDENNSHHHKLKSIEEQVKRGADLTAQLLGFARGGRYEIRPVDLNVLIKSTAGMFGRTKKEISIHHKLREDLWPVEVDRGQIEQVLLNLFVNAWQAMPKGGDLYLETDNVILDETYVKLFSVVPGKYVKVSVTDTGVGMDEKTQQRIFEPFFTTKEMGRGTGLGLASVYGIVKGHRGIINVYSEKGHGTAFNIYLPATEKEVGEEKIAPETLLKGNETILLVDDEEVVIAVSEEILKSLGYNVLTARGGREAIEKYTANWERISLVILDMVMPEMGGGETFDGLKEINPHVKAILASGYSLNAQAIKIMEKGCYAFIQKPFTISSLAQKIREALDGHLET
jgi:two-component system cell cycle sensor histidine kinase/response regulator CckA